ncbi:unnamed protein product [Menidia menidia]|uniref:(Atlantic silverside) hypothetical protein n=1 Tax=Menidia menidia TaxID=238744 RepID=A0A8S4AXB6_9TELE|nr:unnamed protein product [Menidia menidia]
MSLLKRRKFRTFALLFCVISFTMFLFSYTFRDPSLYFFKHAFRLSDGFFSKGLCACRQCIAELEDDPWFAERFNQSIHPLMTRENSVLSDETFKWWQCTTSLSIDATWPKETLLKVLLETCFAALSEVVMLENGAVALSEASSCSVTQWLQSERNPASFSEVVEQLFQVIPDEALYMDAGPVRCRRCSVVGNSGNLKGSHYGRLIDSSDFIIRSVNT